MENADEELLVLCGRFVLGTSLFLLTWSGIIAVPQKFYRLGQQAREQQQKLARERAKAKEQLQAQENAQAVSGGQMVASEPEVEPGLLRKIKNRFLHAWESLLVHWSVCVDALLERIPGAATLLVFVRWLPYATCMTLFLLVTFSEIAQEPMAWNTDAVNEAFSKPAVLQKFQKVFAPNNSMLTHVQAAPPVLPELTDGNSLITVWTFEATVDSFSSKSFIDKLYKESRRSRNAVEFRIADIHKRRPEIVAEHSEHSDVTSNIQLPSLEEINVTVQTYIDPATAWLRRLWHVLSKDTTVIWQTRSIAALILDNACAMGYAWALSIRKVVVGSSYLSQVGDFVPASVVAWFRGHWQAITELKSNYILEWLKGIAQSELFFQIVGAERLFDSDFDSDNRTFKTYCFCRIPNKLHADPDPDIKILTQLEPGANPLWAVSKDLLVAHDELLKKSINCSLYQPFQPPRCDPDNDVHLGQVVLKGSLALQGVRNPLPVVDRPLSVQNLKTTLHLVIKSKAENTAPEPKDVSEGANADRKEEL